MKPEASREQAHTFVDWMADYLTGVEDYPVRSQAAPGDIARRLPDAPPAAAESMERIFEDFRRVILPGITHWQHPSFFAYFPANASPPAMLAEMLASALSAQCMLWQTSPAATELETLTLDWLRQMLGLPGGLTGAIQTTASDATACALIAARERATDGRGNEAGLAALGAEGQRLAVYVSEEAHSSVEKGARIAGFGSDWVRSITTDEQFGLEVEALEAAVLKDVSDGVTPACVIATLGTTGTGGVDPLRPISDLCRKHGVYLHVDAAWAGTALLLEEHRWMIEGAEQADSIVVNPHKWMLTNFDCSAHYVRDPDEFTRAFAIDRAYLTSREGAQVIDYRDWGISLGRRFRALKLWFVIRSYGVEGLRTLVSNHIAWAHEFAAQVEDHPDFELTSGPSLALFSFRFKPEGAAEAELDALNARLVEAINDSGHLYVTQNIVRGHYTIRFAVGQRTTTRDHVLRGWTRIRDLASGLRAGE